MLFYKFFCKTFPCRKFAKSYSRRFFFKAVIKRALSEAGCPTVFVDELMERAHERRWPSGLETLEVRQLNRRQYDHYVCRRIPGKQAVIILACDNRHMPSHLIATPGIVMIFAHGVE